MDQHQGIGKGKTALVIGCGMGDDAIELSQQGFMVTAFDVASSAIELCKKRFSNSSVKFVQADLLAGIPEWHGQFDFVLEIFTIQALPPKYEATLIQHISDFVAENGQLLLITEMQKAKRTFENGPPWLLNSNYISSFEAYGLKQLSLSRSNDSHLGDEIHLCLFEKVANK